MRKKVESVHNSLIVRKDLSEFRLRFGDKVPHLFIFNNPL